MRCSKLELTSLAAGGAAACPAASSPPRCLQAMFEIITSEYSYMHSLSILVSHFMKSEELKETMTQTEHHHLFSNISDILAVSTR